MQAPPFATKAATLVYATVTVSPLSTFAASVRSTLPLLTATALIVAADAWLPRVTCTAKSAAFGVIADRAAEKLTVSFFGVASAIAAPEAVGAATLFVTARFVIVARSPLELLTLSPAPAGCVYVTVTVSPCEIALPAARLTLILVAGESGRLPTLVIVAAAALPPLQEVTLTEKAEVAGVRVRSASLHVRTT